MVQPPTTQPILDGHQPNSWGLYTHYKDSLLKVGWPSPIWFNHQPVLGFNRFHISFRQLDLKSFPKGIKIPRLILWNGTPLKTNKYPLKRDYFKRTCNKHIFQPSIFRGHSLVSHQFSGDIRYICFFRPCKTHGFFSHHFGVSTVSKLHEVLCSHHPSRSLGPGRSDS